MSSAWPVGPRSDGDETHGVIDAVERGEMSRRAAARRYAISEFVAIKWLERVERDGGESLSGTATNWAKADAAP